MLTPFQLVQCYTVTSPASPVSIVLQDIRPIRLHVTLRSELHRNVRAKTRLRHYYRTLDNAAIALHHYAVFARAAPEANKRLYNLNNTSCFHQLYGTKVCGHRQLTQIIHVHDRQNEDLS